MLNGNEARFISDGMELVFVRARHRANGLGVPGPGGSIIGNEHAEALYQQLVFEGFRRLKAEIEQARENGLRLNVDDDEVPSPPSWFLKTN